MTHIEVCNKLSEIRPSAHWNLRGNVYEGLEWLDDIATKPTANELGLEDN